MSGSGITPINSGPLLIRTYTDGSPEDTYLLTRYDAPASSHSILITSTNGALILSQTPFVSSISVSSLIGSTVTMPKLTTILMNVSTLSTTLSILTSTLFSTLSTSSIVTNTANISSLLNTTDISTTINRFQAISGNSLIVDQLNTTVALYGIADATLGNIGFNHLTILSNLTAPVTSSIYTFSNIISTTTYQFDQFSSNSIIGPSISCSLLSSNQSFIIKNVTNTLNYNSTIYCSTISTSNFSYLSFLATGVYDAFNTITVYGSSMIASTINCTNLFNSTIYINILNTNQLTLSTNTYSTMSGGLLILSSLTTSTFYISTIYGSTTIFSSVNTTNLYGPTINTSTLNASQINTNLLNVSSIIGGTEQVSSLNVSTLSVSTLIGSTFFGTVSYVSSGNLSTSYGNILLYSTANGSTINTTQLSVSNLTFSTLVCQIAMPSTIIVSSSNLSIMLASTVAISSSNVVNLNPSTLYVSTSAISNVYTNIITCSTIAIRTLTVSTLIASTILYSSLLISTATVCTLNTSTCNTLRITASNNTNTGIGYQSLLNNTSGSNNTSLGYTSLLNNTAGSYNTGLGVQTFYYNTTGSYNTGIGYNAGFYSGFTGNNNVYIGYNAYPSGTNVSNEIVIGGSYNSGYSNNGNGSNTVTIGNLSTYNAVLFGNVGVNTSAPGTTLDVHGSSQIMGGNVTITNSQPYFSSAVTLYSDSSSSGMSLFLNGSLQYQDGGPGHATLRNNYGSLRLQAIGGNGITILSNGNIGIGSNSPNVTLDIGGTTTVSGTLYTTTLNFTGSFQHNGVAVANSSQWSGTNPVYYTSGNVGIKTTTPSYTLDVNGSGNITGSVFTSTIISGSITCGAINTQSNSFTCGSINTSGATVSCNSFNAGSNTVQCGNLIANTIQNIPIYTNFPSYLTNDTYFISGTAFSLGSWSCIMSGSSSNTADQYGNIIPANSSNLVISSLNSAVTLNYSNPTFWVSGSDRRIKNTIQTIDTCIDSVVLLNPVTYTIIDDSSNKVHHGFIAQEVQDIFPLVVSDSRLNPDNKYDSTLLGIHSALLLPYLIRAFQEQHHHINIQNNKLELITSTISNQYIQINHMKEQLTRLKNILKTHQERTFVLQTKRDKLRV